MLRDLNLGGARWFMMMKPFAALCLAIGFAGCASYSGSGLVAGQSTLSDVEALMGPPVERRPGPNGEMVLWYSRLPYGRQSYAARIGADGRLIAVEQRLTEENIGKLIRGRTRAEEVRDLFGPPYRPMQFPRMQREIWTYQMHGYPNWKVLYVQFSPDHIVREVYYMDDPEARPKRR